MGGVLVGERKQPAAENLEAERDALTPLRVARWAGGLGVAWFGFVFLQGFLAARGWTFLALNYDLSSQFGSALGGLGAAAAGVAAVGAWQTVSDQRAALALARRNEQHANKLAAKRDFESTFFRLLEALDRNVAQTDVGGFFKPRTGKDAFSAIIDEMNQIRAKEKLGVEDAYMAIFLKHQDDLAHYIRLLFNMVDIADRAADLVESYAYVKLLRATLSESELLLLALNGLFHPEGREHFKPLIERYALLNNLSASARADFDLLDAYKPGAFKKGAETLDDINEEFSHGE